MSCNLQIEAVVKYDILQFKIQLFNSLTLLHNLHNESALDLAEL